MAVIRTNIAAQYAQDALAANQKSMSSAMQQLASGNRINTARDDAAGLSIAQNMTSQIRGLNQAVRNATDGINLLQTADGGLVATSNMLQRMRELAIQSSNGSNSTSQRGYLNNEFKSLQDEITRVGNNTTWNNMNLYGSVAASPNVFIFQAGTASGATIGVSIAAMNASALLVDANVAVISTFTGAQAAITSVDAALEIVNNARSSMGAAMAQLSYSADNMVNVSTNLAASRSTIMDTDYAMATSQLSKAQIIQQSAMAMLAQANQQPKMVLDLLK